MGLTVWTLAAAFGVAAVVRASAVAFTVLKVVGACYLAWLGVQALRSAWRRDGHALAVAGRSRRPLGALGGFRQGLFSDLSNPKIAVFFTGLLPQFVSSRHAVLEPFLLLGGLFVLMTLAWLCAYSLVAARISVVLTRPRVKAAIDAVTGTVLIGFGVTLALQRR